MGGCLWLWLGIAALLTGLFAWVHEYSAGPWMLALGVVIIWRVVTMED